MHWGSVSDCALFKVHTASSWKATVTWQINKRAFNNYVHLCFVEWSRTFPPKKKKAAFFSTQKKTKNFIVLTCTRSWNEGTSTVGLSSHIFTLSEISSWGTSSVWGQVIRWEWEQFCNNTKHWTTAHTAQYMKRSAVQGFAVSSWTFSPSEFHSSKSNSPLTHCMKSNYRAITHCSCCQMELYHCW